MRIIELISENTEVTLHAYGKPSSVSDLEPMELIVTAIAKDVLQEIKTKSSLMNLQLENFSVKVILKKNEEKAKSKIIETHLNLPETLSLDITNKLQKIADKSHVKRMLGNEIIFAQSQLKE